MARSRVASVRLQALSCPTWRSPSSRMLSAGTALLKESSTWGLDFTGWFLSCATGCKLHSLWRIRWVSSELCGPTPTLPLWTIWSVLVCKDVQRSWPYISYIIAWHSCPTIRNWSCGHEWEGKHGGFPVPADIFIFIYYICIVPPLGAFKSQLGGTYSISRLFDAVNVYCDYIFRYLYIWVHLIVSCCCVGVFCTPDAFHNKTRNDSSDQVCVCVCARVHVSAAPIYWKLYVFFPIYLRIIRDTKIFRGISRSGTTSPRIRIPLFAS